MEENEMGQHNFSSLASSLVILNDRTKTKILYSQKFSRAKFPSSKTLGTGHFSDTAEHGRAGTASGTGLSG